MFVWRQQFAGGRRQLVAWGFWCRGRHSQFTRHDPRGTFRRSQNETFSRKLPRSRRRKRRVSFPSAHQDYQRRVPPIRLTCWYLCCGNFPSANYSGEVETATRWSGLFHSRWHNVLPRVLFPPLKGLREPEESQGPYKGSSHDGVVTRLGGRIARVLSRRKVRQAHIGRKSRWHSSLFDLRRQPLPPLFSISLSGTFAEFHSDLVTRFCNAPFFFLCPISP